MQKTIFISLPIEELQEVITNCVNSCLEFTKQSPAQNEQPINTKELCSFLGITTPTAIRWRKKGKLPFLQIGSRILYQKEKVLAALENKKRG